MRWHADAAISPVAGACMAMAARLAPTRAREAFVVTPWRFPHGLSAGGTFGLGLIIDRKTREARVWAVCRSSAFYGILLTQERDVLSG